MASTGKAVSDHGIWPYWFSRSTRLEAQLSGRLHSLRKRLYRHFCPKPTELTVPGKCRKRNSIADCSGQDHRKKSRKTTRAKANFLSLTRWAVPLSKSRSHSYIRAMVLQTLCSAWTWQLANTLLEKQAGQASSSKETAQWLSWFRKHIVLKNKIVVYLQHWEG